MSEWDKQAARETPVKDKCIWGKIKPENADPSVAYVPIGNDGEEICTECLRDLRTMKRYSTIQIRLSTAYSMEAHEIINDKLREAAAEIQQLDRDDELLEIDPFEVHNAESPQ